MKDKVTETEKESTESSRKLSSLEKQHEFLKDLAKKAADKTISAATKTLDNMNTDTVGGRTAKEALSASLKVCVFSWMGQCDKKKQPAQRKARVMTTCELYEVGVWV